MKVNERVYLARPYYVTVPGDVDANATVQQLRFGASGLVLQIEKDETVYHVHWDSLRQTLRVNRECIEPDEAGDTEVEAAIESIKSASDKHPDLVRLENKLRRAIEQGYTPGDVNHYVQPIVGTMRLRQSKGEPVVLDGDALEYTIDRLMKACAAESALLAYLDPKKYGLPEED